MSAGMYSIRPAIWCLALMFLAKGVSSLKSPKMSVPEVVEAGNSVTLSCKYDLEGESLYSIKWYWEYQEFYRYVPTDTPHQQYFHLPRFNVDTSKSNSTHVTLTNVRQEQSGNYSCEVTADAPYFHTWLKNAPMVVKGKSFPNILRISVPEVVESGNSVTLSCDYDLGDEPLYSTNWYWKGQMFYRYIPKNIPQQLYFHMPYFNVDISQSGPSNVTLIGVRQEQSGIYTCEVSSDAPYFRSMRKNASMIVKGISSPKIVRLSVPQVVESGDLVTLSCEYNLGNESLYAMKWYWKEHEFYRYVPNVIPQQTYFRLPYFNVDISRSGPNQVTLTDVQQEQSGKYTCEVSSEAPAFRLLQKNATMIVKESSSVAAMKFSVPKIVKSGDTVTMSCGYDTKEKPILILRWFRNEQEFYRYAPNAVPQQRYFELPHFNVDISKSGPFQVTLKDIRREQSGRYKCEVISNAPSFNIDSRNATMIVTEHPPDDLTLTVEPKKVEIGKLVKAECSASGSRPTANFTWLINEKKVVGDSNRVNIYLKQTDNETKSILEVTITRSHLVGSKMVIKCEANVLNLWNKTVETPVEEYVAQNLSHTSKSSQRKQINKTETAPFYLEVRGISVPKVVKSGDTVTLLCDYDMNQEPLFILKWYWKSHEFYRYVPNEIPRQKYFPLRHFNVDISRSSPTQVTLTGIRREQSGNYKCEVTSDAPYFNTESKNATMVVAELPPNDPVLTVQPQRVEIGSKVEAECSVPSANPPANLTWLLNDEEITVDQNGVNVFPMQFQTDKALGLQSVKIRLEVIANKSHFIEGKMMIKCKASVFTLWNKTVETPVAENVAEELPTTLSSVSSPQKRNKRWETGLTGLRISVPEVVKSGDTVTLSCEYDLGQVALYSINWYWKGQEFYRYVPKESPPQRDFHVTHFNIDISRSGPTQVTLKGVRRELSGRYECEVSCDAPLFYTGHKNATMIVAELSQDDPVLTVQPDRVEIGTKVQAECSAPGSDPPANLTWLINDEEITEDNESVKIYPKRIQTDAALGLHSAKIKMEVITNRSHFINGVMIVRCEVSVFTLWNRSVETSVVEFITQQFAPALDSVSSQQSQTKEDERDFMHHGSAEHASHSFNMIMFFTLFIIFCCR